MEEFVAALADSYGITREDVLFALDKVLTGKAFRRATGAAFGELADEGIIAYGRNGARLLGVPGRDLMRVLRRDLSVQLRDRTTAIDYDHWQKLEHKVTAGRIVRMAGNGDLLIALEVKGIYGEVVAEHIAVCPVRQQPPRERGAYRSGEQRMFYVESVTPIRQRDGTSKVDIILSRTHRSLPERLLNLEILAAGEENRVRCEKRVVSKVSYLLAQRSVPRSLIVKVQQELGERIKVRYEDALSGKDRLRKV